MKRLQLIFALAGTALATLAAATDAPTAVAQETQKWHGKGAIVSTAANRLKVDDRAGHIVGMLEWDGAISNGEGKPFLEKARYQVVSLIDTGSSSGGYKTFTEPDGSKVFAKYLTTEVKLPVINGTFEFIGGTGKYEGITGRGKFHEIMVSDKAAWDELTGEYTLPAKVGQNSK